MKNELTTEEINEHDQAIKGGRTMNQIKCPNCGEVFTIDDAGYLAIAAQVKNNEFAMQVDARVEEKVAAIKAHYAAEHQLDGVKHKEEIVKLNEQLNVLYGKLERQNAETELAVTKAKLAKEEEIEKLKGFYEAELQKKDFAIDYYKDLKISLSTKMIGESLEQYCLNKFNEVRPMAFPNAYFEKDNEVVDHNKADFVYRDYTDDKLEYISIIFEMKHEADDTKVKQKNEQFFAKLDKERKEKGVEYAVLVSTLEADNDYYNAGIVDVSHRYDKMFVVRPQNFLTIISILRNAAKQNIADRRALREVQERNVDVVALETELVQFQQDFATNVDRADKFFDSAIEQVNKSIAALEKTRDNLLSSKKQLGVANNKAEALTMRKLLKNSPSLKQEYKETKKN